MGPSDSSSGFARLPNEIIGEILSRYPSLSPARADSLASVCLRWRHVAHGTPDLWCSIDVEVEKQPPPLARIELWLQRSRSKPLSIGITTGCHKINLEEMNEYIRRVLRLVTPHLHRWQHLKLAVARNDHVAAFQDFPLLHNAFQLSNVEVDFDDNEDLIIHAIATAPRLKKLTWLSFAETPVWEVIPAFPGANITHLEILWNRGWDSMSFMLVQCTSVVTLNLRAVTPIEAFPPSIPTTASFPKLKALFIETFSFSALELVAQLDSPALEVLHLRFETDELEEDEEGRVMPTFQRFFSFITSNRHNISVLKLESFKPLPANFLPPFFGSCRSKNIASVELDLPARDGWSSALHTSITDFLDNMRPPSPSALLAPFHVDDCEAGKKYGILRMGWLDMKSVCVYLSKISKMVGVRLLNLGLAGPCHCATCDESKDTRILE